MLPGMNRCTIVVALAFCLAAAAPAHADLKDDSKAAASDAKAAAVHLKDGATAVAHVVVSYTHDTDAAANAALKVIRVAGEITVATGNRVRRSIAFGTHAGTYAGTSFGAGNQLVTGVTFGMALYQFDVPSILDIDKLLQAQLEIAIKAEAARIVAEGGIPDLEAIARNAYMNLKEDIMGKIRPRTLEEPKLGVIIEGVAQTQPGDVMGGNAMGARVSVTYGVGPISLGLGGGFLRGDGNTAAYAGPNLSLRLTPWGKSWTPVIDLYARGDVGFDEGERHYVVTVGGRMLLDLI